MTREKAVATQKLATKVMPMPSRALYDLRPRAFTYKQWVDFRRASDILHELLPKVRPASRRHNLKRALEYVAMYMAQA